MWRPAPTFADGDASPIAITVSAPAPDRESEELRAIHLLGNQTVDLPLVIRGRSEKPVDVRARLVQVAFFLGAPFRESVEILSGRTVNGEPLTVTASVPLPEVTDETEFELRFQVRTSGEAWREAGRTRIRLYSKKILEPLKRLSENIVLRLKDEDAENSGLRSLLEDLEVTEGAQDHLFDTHPAAILRPDRYVFGVVDDEWDLDRLLIELGRKLSLR